MSIKLPYHHICYEASRDVSQIVSPLLQNTEFSYFCYGRMYNDGGLFFINNNVPLLQGWLDSPCHSGASAFDEEGKFLWTDFLTENDIRNLNHRGHNVGVGLSITKKHDNYVELFEFNTPHGINSSLYYFKHQELMDKYCLYFKEQANRLIEKATKNLIYIPEKIEVAKHKLQMPNTSSQLMNELDIDTFYINDNLNVKLTQREKSCLKRFIMGDTSPMIGKALGISEKTVQTYMLRIKQKFLVQSNAELYNLLWQLGFIKSSILS